MSLETLDRLVKACGYDLEIHLNYGTRQRSRFTIWQHHPTAQPGYEYHRVRDFTTEEDVVEWLRQEVERMKQP